MSDVSVKRSEVINAIRDNDCEKVAKMLEDFDFSKTETLPLTDGRHKLALALLTQASAAAGGRRLDKKVVYCLIDYLATSVDLFDFLSAMLTWHGCPQGSGYDKIIPKELRDILAADHGLSCSANYATKKVSKILTTLPQDAFMATCDYLGDGNVQTFPVGFIPYFIRYVYEHRLLSENWVLAYMALCLRGPIRLPKLEPFGIAVTGELGDFLHDILGSN